MKQYSLILLLLLLLGVLNAQSTGNDNPLGQAVSDSLNFMREREIRSEYGFNDDNTLAEVAKKLSLADVDKWKGYLGLEAENKKLDTMSLRKLGIAPYKALLAQQYCVFGFTELSTLAEVSASLKMPIKKLKQMLKLRQPNSRNWDNHSLQAINWTPQDIQNINQDFKDSSLAYGVNITLVGMLTVFAALVITSLVISQLIHLNRPPKAKTADLKLSPGGKVIAASATLNQSVIVAIITALHMHQASTEDRKRMALTFRRTPTNQWRASAVLSMPNREISSKRR